MTYDSYAPIYDATAQDGWSVAQANWIMGWLRERGIMSTSVLDLGCGTGSVALVFAATDCHVIGVDRSAAMLAIAEGKARDAGAEVAFAQTDIGQLTNDERRMTITPPQSSPRVGRAKGGVHRPSSLVPRPYDLVTCFDALNELTADGDLERMCIAVATMLRPGGWFVFDMWDAGVLMQDERDVVIHISADCVVYHRFSYDAETGVTTRRVVWLVREIERWWRGEEMHRLRAWSSDDIQTALAAAGLRLVEQTRCSERMMHIAQRL